MRVPLHGRGDLDRLRPRPGLVRLVLADEREAQGDDPADGPDLEHRVRGAPRGEEMERSGCGRGHHWDQGSYAALGISSESDSSAGASPSSAGPFGSHSSQLGRYQFQSPSSFIAAGSRTPRTSVASISTAAARPTPNCFMSMNESVAKTPNTPTITSAAAVTTPAVDLMPWPTASSVDSPRSTASLIRLRMNTW